MKIDCPLCQTEISVLKTKAGKSYANCHNCHMRMFVNSKLGEELLEQISDSGVTSPDESQASPQKIKSKVDDGHSQVQAIVQEVKKLGNEIRALKEERASSSASSRPRVGSDAMANWFSGGA